MNICHFSSDSLIFREIEELVKNAILSHAERLHEWNQQYTIPLDLETLRSPDDADLGPVTDVIKSAMATGGATAKDNTLETFLTLHEWMESARREPQFPVFMVPHKFNPSHWGRNGELQKLDQILLSNVEGQLVPHGACVVMSGVGGIGKSDIALHYTHSKRMYFDAIIWIRADTPSRLADEFAVLSTKLGLELPEDLKDPTVSKNLVLGWLARTERPWLLVFDSADDTDIIIDYWPMSTNGAIIVTTRDPAAHTRLYGASDIPVEPFSTQEASSFLQSLGNHDPESSRTDKSTSRIATLLGGHPLGIIQMASVIERLELSYDEFIGLYESHYSNMPTLKDELHTLPEVWSLSFDQLSPESKDLLNTLSFLDSDGIPEQLFQQFPPTQSAHPHTTFLTNVQTYTKARTELMKSSLVTRKRERGHLSIPRIVQDSIRFRMSKSQASEVFGITISLLRILWPQSVAENQFLFSPQAQDSTAETVLPHLLRMKELCKQYGDSAIPLDLEHKISFVEMLQLGG
jgi:hypothetical protein